MKDPIDDSVHHAIAEHLGVESTAIHAEHRFARDLSMQPLDVVLVALRLEETEKVELPIERLDAIATVAHLTALVRHSLGALRARIEADQLDARRRRAVRRSLMRSFRFG